MQLYRSNCFEPMHFNRSVILQVRWWVCCVLIGIFSGNPAQAQLSIADRMRKADSMLMIYGPASSKQQAQNKMGVSGNTGTPFRKNPLPKPYQQRPENLSSCIDTSSRTILFKDSTHFFMTFPSKTRDGNFITSGEYYNYWQTANPDMGYAMKFDPYGNVLWANTYDSAGHALYQLINYYNSLELADGSILLTGTTVDHASENDDIIITKLNAGGQIIWTKTYYSRVWTHGNGSADAFFVQSIKQDPLNGNIYITSPSWAMGIYLICLEPNNGNVLWSNLYHNDTNGYGFEKAGGVIIKPNELILAGAMYVYNSHLLLYRIDKNTGDTLSTRVLDLQDTSAHGFLVLGQVQELNNGRFAYTGSELGYYRYLYDGSVPLYQAGYAIIDSSLNFEKGYSFLNHTENNQSNTQVTMNRDESVFFSATKVLSGYTAEVYYTQSKQEVILKERKRHAASEGYPNQPPSWSFYPGSDFVVQMMGDSGNYRSGILISKLHLTDTSSDCLGRSVQENTLKAFRYGGPRFAFFDSIRRNVFLERRPYTVTAAPLIVDAPLPYCKQTSFCDTLKLRVSADTTCVQHPVTITAQRNAECGSLIQLAYDTSVVQSFITLNDSTYQIVFSKSWEGTLRGTLAGCTLYSDSVKMVVLQSPTSLNLGADRDICPGNQMLLNARKGFARYRWQDGSTDSTFTVTSPGTYHVTAYNACGGFLSDTIVISAHQPAAFSAGPDRNICRGDTITLSATTGFQQYNWQPATGILQPQNSSVQVHPTVNTQYIVQAEESTNCLVRDTIWVLVKPVPVIRLGNDTSFCAGNSVTLNAGPGFISYLWNNGAQTQQITVATAGSYSVIATTADLCVAKDSFQVLNVYPLPIVSLGNNRVLCSGTTRTLNGGTFSSYHWNTGASTPSITISQTGYYRLDVTDNHNCSAFDSLSITRLQTNPSGFLQNDTSMCNYGTLTLNSTGSYRQYNWSNGAHSATASISQPGTYWLEVTDEFGCKGTEQVRVQPKDCLLGLYVPTAFTPNSNGQNNYFRPLLYGAAEHFEFEIYNRYGQLLFHARTASPGWDGALNGQPQNAGSYVWVCRYKLAGQSLKLKKGSFLLLR